MALHIVRNDITRESVDAIVNAANESLLGGGGVDGAIHRAAGPELLAECRTLGGCSTGDAKITGAYRLPARYVIHTVGPVWRGGQCGERELLASCYRTSLQLAKDHHCESIAFPLISSGIYGYPKAEALQVAVSVISEFLLENEMDVRIVVFDRNAVQVSSKLFAEVQEFVNDNYVAEHEDSPERKQYRMRQLNIPDSAPISYAAPEPEITPDQSKKADYASFFKKRKKTPEKKKKQSESQETYDTSAADELQATYGASSLDESRQMPSLNEMLDDIDESFSEMLLRKIDEAGIKDSTCYKRANIDRKLFSKIRSDRNYRPKKQTAIAFAIALELDLPETEELLRKAGYALSHANKFDIIIEYFIRKKNYNIFEINEVLFSFDQQMLG